MYPGWKFSSFPAVRERKVMLELIMVGTREHRYALP